MRIIVALVLACTLLACTATTDEVVVGAVIPITGFGAYIGEPVERGMRLALEEVDNVEVIFEDSKGEAAEAVTVGTKLLTVDNVDVIYVEFSGPSNAINPIVKEHGKIMIYDSYSITPLKENPYAFKTFFDPYVECKKLAAAAKEQGHTIGVMLALMDLKEECKAGILEEAPGAIVSEFDPQNTESFRTDILKFQSQGVTGVVMAAGYEKNLLKFQQELLELDAKLALFCGPKEDCFSENTRESIPEQTLENNIAFDVRVSAEFKDKYLARYPEASVTDFFIAANGYDMIHIISAAAKQCPEITSECLKQWMINNDYVTAITTEGGFNEGRRLQILSDLIQYKDGEFVVI